MIPNYFQVTWPKVTFILLIVLSKIVVLRMIVIRLVTESRRFPLFTGHMLHGQMSRSNCLFLHFSLLNKVFFGWILALIPIQNSLNFFLNSTSKFPIIDSKNSLYGLSKYDIFLYCVQFLYFCSSSDKPSLSIWQNWWTGIYLFSYII